MRAYKAALIHISLPIFGYIFVYPLVGSVIRAVRSRCRFIPLLVYSGLLLQPEDAAQFGIFTVVLRIILDNYCLYQASKIYGSSEL